MDLLYVDPSTPRVKHPIHSQLNWAILLCDVIPDGKTEWTAQFWQVIEQASELSSPVVYHTENCAVHSGNPTVSSLYLPTPRWHHLKAHLFLTIHSADEDRMMYSFSNTTSYSTFYAIFSDSITADVASKQQTTALFLSTLITRSRIHTEQNKKKNWQTWWETYAVPENIQFSFSCSFLHR
jgi:hypothetical protein